MNNNSTLISYEAVRGEAQKIKSSAATMKNILDDFNSTMNQVIAPDVFEGNASQSFQESYQRLRSKFDAYTQTVEHFANTILGAASATEQTEKSLANEASNLPG